MCIRDSYLSLAMFLAGAMAHVLAEILPQLLFLGDLLAAAAVAPWPEELHRTLLCHARDLKTEVRAILEPLRACGLHIPVFQGVARPAMCFDTHSAPHGLIIVARCIWNIDVSAPGNLRQFLAEGNWTRSSWLPAMNPSLAQPLDTIRWLTEHLHMIAWFPNTVSLRLNPAVRARFPQLPQEEGRRGGYFLMYICYKQLGVALAFWEDLFEDGDRSNSEPASVSSSSDSEWDASSPPAAL